MYTYCHNNPIAYIDPTGHVSITVNGQNVGNATINGGRSYGNLTDIAYGLGGTTAWDSSTKTATVTIGGNAVEYKLSTITNGVGVASDGSTFTVSKDGKIQVAVADTSSRLGGSTASWDGSTKSVTVNTSNSQLAANLGINASGSAADAIANSYKDSLKNSSGNPATPTTSKNTDTNIHKDSQSINPQNTTPSITDWSKVESKLDPFAYKGVEDPSKYLYFANTAQTLIDPVFAGRLAKYAKDYGIIISITSNGGKRSYEDQVKAYKASGGYQDKNGSWKGGNGTAAVPGTGWHELGFAIDIDKKKEDMPELRSLYANDKTVDQKGLLEYGLFKPMTPGNGYLGKGVKGSKGTPEPWHIQAIETEGIPKKDRFKLFGKTYTWKK